MKFTYESYANLIKLVQEHGYEICNYHNHETKQRPAILRHDIDVDPIKALTFARLEAELGVTSTYFVLLTSDFYNVFSERNQAALQEMISLGHEVGLHFDEVRYNDGKVVEHIREEAEILGRALGRKVTSVSMHRPSRATLEANYSIDGIINSYGEPFFTGFKYVSDSRMHWREDVEAIVASEEYDRLHILTHPMPYNECEISMHDTLKEFLVRYNELNWHFLNDNFTDLPSVLSLEEVQWKENV